MTDAWIPTLLVGALCAYAALVDSGGHWRAVDCLLVGAGMGLIAIMYVGG